MRVPSLWAPPVTFEAAYDTSWVARLLAELGLEPHLAHPSGCRAIADAKLKNDRVDARTIANLLRTGYLAEAWLASREVREQRILLRARLAREAPHDWEDPDQCPARRRGHLWVVSDWAFVAVLDERISLLEAGIRRQAKPDACVEALMAIPGIGLLTAMDARR